MRQDSPITLPSSILDEVVDDDFEIRFHACIAVEATVWGHGLRCCNTPVERATWQVRYASHLWQLYQAWHYTGLQPRAPLSPDEASGLLRTKKTDPLIAQPRQPEGPSRPTQRT